MSLPTSRSDIASANDRLVARDVTCTEAPVDVTERQHERHMVINPGAADVSPINYSDVTAPSGQDRCALELSTCNQPTHIQCHSFNDAHGPMAHYIKQTNMTEPCARFSETEKIDYDSELGEPCDTQRGNCRHIMTEYAAVNTSQNASASVDSSLAAAHTAALSGENTLLDGWENETAIGSRFDNFAIENDKLNGQMADTEHLLDNIEASAVLEQHEASACRVKAPETSRDGGAMTSSDEQLQQQAQRIRQFAAEFVAHVIDLATSDPRLLLHAVDSPYRRANDVVIAEGKRNKHERQPSLESNENSDVSRRADLLPRSLSSEPQQTSQDTVEATPGGNEINLLDHGRAITAAKPKLRRKVKFMACEEEMLPAAAPSDEDPDESSPDLEVLEILSNSLPGDSATAAALPRPNVDITVNECSDNSDDDDGPDSRSAVHIVVDECSRNPCSSDDELHRCATTQSVDITIDECSSVGFSSDEETYLVKQAVTQQRLCDAPSASSNVSDGGDSSFSSSSSDGEAEYVIEHRFREIVDPRFQDVTQFEQIANPAIVAHNEVPTKENSISDNEKTHVSAESTDDLMSLETTKRAMLYDRNGALGESSASGSVDIVIDECSSNASSTELESRLLVNSAAVDVLVDECSSNQLSPDTDDDVMPPPPSPLNDDAVPPPPSHFDDDVMPPPPPHLDDDAVPPPSSHFDDDVMPPIPAYLDDDAVPPVPPHLDDTRVLPAVSAMMGKVTVHERPSSDLVTQSCDVDDAFVVKVEAYVTRIILSAMKQLQVRTRIHRAVF